MPEEPEDPAVGSEASFSEIKKEVNESVRKNLPRVSLKEEEEEKVQFSVNYMLYRTGKRPESTESISAEEESQEGTNKPK